MQVVDYRDLTEKIFETIEKFKIVNSTDIMDILDIASLNPKCILRAKDLKTYEARKEKTIANIFNIRMRKINSTNKERFVYNEDKEGNLIAVNTPSAFIKHKSEYIKLVNFISTLATVYKLTSLDDIYVLNPSSIVIKRINPKTNESEVAKVVLLNYRYKNEDVLTEEEIRNYEIERVILLLDSNKINLYKEYTAPLGVNLSLFTNYNGRYIAAKTIIELKNKIKND
ncbi:TPA: hypothetical protein ACF0PM_002120 [Clostridium perfringens]